jgi:sugar/nucleoside kinase (ribokinase family)
MPANKAEIYNTIGAGDTHAGMCLYGLQNDFSIEQMLKAANEKAARKVSGLLD